MRNTEIRFPMLLLDFNRVDGDQRLIENKTKYLNDSILKLSIFSQNLSEYKRF